MLAGFIALAALFVVRLQCERSHSAPGQRTGRHRLAEGLVPGVSRHPAAIASAIAMVRLAISACCNRSTIRPSIRSRRRERFYQLLEAAMILRASAISSAGGVKIALQASIWPGWISVLPSAEVAALRAFGGKAVDIRKSL